MYVCSALNYFLVYISVGVSDFNLRERAKKNSVIWVACMATSVVVIRTVAGSLHSFTSLEMHAIALEIAAHTPLYLFSRWQREHVSLNHICSLKISIWSKG